MSTRTWVAVGSLACVAAGWLATGSTVSTSFTTSTAGSITAGSAVWLDNADQCKNGGWQTSTRPVFKNQGDCVSWFAVPSRGPAGEPGSTAAAHPQESSPTAATPRSAATVASQPAQQPVATQSTQQPTAPQATADAMAPQPDPTAQQPAPTPAAADPSSTAEPGEG